MNIEFVTKKVNDMIRLKRVPQAMLFHASFDLSDFIYDFTAHFLNVDPSSKHKILNKNHPDVFELSTEKKEISVENIRELIRWINLYPNDTDKKVIWIKEANKLNKSSSNALLKTLEEPPSYAHFVLTCQKPEQLLPTILSRVLITHVHLNNKLDHDHQEEADFLDELNTFILSQKRLPHSLVLDLVDHIISCQGQLPMFFKKMYDHLKSQMLQKPERIHLYLSLFDRLVLIENQTLIHYGNANIWLSQFMLKMNEVRHV